MGVFVTFFTPAIANSVADIRIVFRRRDDIFGAIDFREPLTFCARLYSLDKERERNDISNFWGDGIGGGGRKDVGDEVGPPPGGEGTIGGE